MPPIPSAVVTENGETIYTRADIQKGRQVWQSIGGHQLGSIWGHGSYVAPDWTADWLHRELYQTDARVMFVAIKLGSFALLLPIYVTPRADGAQG